MKNEILKQQYFKQILDWSFPWQKYGIFREWI